MFSSILLGTLIACNQPSTTAEYVPGVIETDGKLIATVKKNINLVFFNK